MHLVEQVLVDIETLTYATQSNMSATFHEVRQMTEDTALWKNGWLHRRCVSSMVVAV